MAANFSERIKMTLFIRVHSRFLFQKEDTLNGLVPDSAKR